MATKLNWGIMATGGIARKFARDLAQSRTGRFAAVGSRSLASAEAFARDFGGARAHGSYEALLADPEVAAVYVATPHPMHLEWAIRAAGAGKHILCEKPLALNRAGAARIIAAAQQHRVFLMEAFMYRCHPQTAALAGLVRDGAIGEVRLIQAAFSVACKFDAEHRLFKRELGGGAILDLGCYPVSFARLIAGAAPSARAMAAPSARALPAASAGALPAPTLAEPVEFKATGRLHPLTQTDEYATAVVKFPGDIVAELSCGSTVVHDVSARIHGTTGWLDVPVPFFPGLDGADARFFLHRHGAAAPEEFAFPGRGVGLYAHEADAVGHARARGEFESPAMSHADTLGNMAALDEWRSQVGVRYDGE